MRGFRAKRKLKRSKKEVQTIVSSPTQTVVIGPGRPFVIIGERINPTGRKLLAAEMAAGNFERVRADAIAQVAAGAHMLDVNAGVPLAVEPEFDESGGDVPVSMEAMTLTPVYRAAGGGRLQHAGSFRQKGQMLAAGTRGRTPRDRAAACH